MNLFLLKSHLFNPITLFSIHTICKSLIFFLYLSINCLSMYITSMLPFRFENMWHQRKDFKPKINIWCLKLCRLYGQLKKSSLNSASSNTVLNHGTKRFSVSSLRWNNNCSTRSLILTKRKRILGCLTKRSNWEVLRKENSKIWFSERRYSGDKKLEFNKWKKVTTRRDFFTILPIAQN